MSPSGRVRALGRFSTTVVACLCAAACFGAGGYYWHAKAVAQMSAHDALETLKHSNDPEKRCGAVVVVLRCMRTQTQALLEAKVCGEPKSAAQSALALDQIAQLAKGEPR